MDTFLYEIFEEIFSENDDYYLVKENYVITFENAFGGVYFDVLDKVFNKEILTELNEESYRDIIDNKEYYEYYDTYKGLYDLVKYCLHPKHKIEKLRNLQLIN
jgi:hypothetical protein